MIIRSPLSPTLLLLMISAPLFAQVAAPVVPADQSRYQQLNEKLDLQMSSGQFEPAVKTAEELIKVSEKTFGPHHENTDKALSRLAEVYQKTVDLAAQQGREDATIAHRMTDLAKIYQELKRYTEAEPLYQKALAILEDTEGPESATYAQSLNNMALLKHHEGKILEATTLFRQALAVYEQIYGPNHRDVAYTLINLGSAYRNQGKFVEAEVSFKRSLEILEKKLGPNNPALIRALNNYSGLFYIQGKFAEAEPVVLKALQIAEKNYGLTNHPDLMATLNNLEWIYAKLGRTEDLTKIQEKTSMARLGTEAKP